MACRRRRRHAAEVVGAWRVVGKQDGQGRMAGWKRQGQDRRWTWDVGLLSVCAGSRRLEPPLQVLGPPHLVSRPTQRCSIWAYFTYGNERASYHRRLQFNVAASQAVFHQHNLPAGLRVKSHFSRSYKIGLLHVCVHDISVTHNLGPVAPWPRGAHAIVFQPPWRRWKTDAFVFQSGLLVYAEEAHSFSFHRLYRHSAICAPSLRPCAWTATSVTPSVSACAGPNMHARLISPCSRQSVYPSLKPSCSEGSRPRNFSQIDSLMGESRCTQTECNTDHQPTRQLNASGQPTVALT